MAEYIEREALLKEIGRREKLMIANKTVSVDAVKTFIKNRPATDVVPVVHGRWNVMLGTKTRRICSNCGWDVSEYGKFYSYCPNCGAMMDGGVDNAAD